MPLDREYLERALALMRREWDKPCPWPQLAKMLANEVERLWAREEQTRQALRDVKRYAVYHGLLIGECVAWAKLKEAYGVEAAFQESRGEGGGE